MSHDICISRLREIVSYCPKTGSFVWLPRKDASGRRFGLAGRPALDVACNKGYLHSNVFLGGQRRTIRAHRAAIALTTGKWPVKEVDHINGNKSDNRICNLREATRSQNAMNQRRHSGLSGIKGVSFHKGKWRSRIFVNGRSQHLGYFKTKEDAARAYDSAAMEYFGAFASPNLPNQDR